MTWAALLPALLGATAGGLLLALAGWLLLLLARRRRSRRLQSRPMAESPIGPGSHPVLLVCPRCGEHSVAWAELGCRLTVEAEESTLRAVMHSKGQAHLCGQHSTLTPTTTEDPDDGDGTPALDWAQRAAGPSAV